MHFFNPEQIDNQIDQEKSRTVKICLVKYKCVLLLTFMLLCLGQFIYLIFSSKPSAELVNKVLEQLIKFSNKSVAVEESE